MTTVVYVGLGLGFIARIVADSGSIGRCGETHEAARTVDGMPLLGLALLGLCWAAYRREPLHALGLSLSTLAQCPWPSILGVWAGAFVLNRAVHSYLFRSQVRRLVADGTINPGGTWQALEGTGLPQAALLGAGMTFSQTFIEEILFRGLMLSAVVWSSQRLGAPGPVALVVGAVGSSVAFGLVHFIPMRLATRGVKTLLPWSALVVPSVLGVVFCALNAQAGSLWPGWFIHWWLNYAGFIWQKVSREWDRAYPRAAAA